MKTRKSCWTCTNRRVRCDGVAPTCKTCARLQLFCQGYGMRLSWPQNSDSKRAIVGWDASTDLRLPHQARGHDFFVNTTWTDVTVYRGSFLHMQPSGSVNLPLLQLRKQSSCMDLLHHFHNEAYRSFVTLDKSNLTPQLRDVLLRLATSDHSASGLSVFFSLLAYSSLHRHGLQAHAVEFKVTAVRLLSASLESNPSDTATTAQQIATSMLLAAFDILSPSEDSREWLWHVWGANDIIRTARFEDQECVDADVLIDWVYYHNALSRFAVQHWRNKSLTEKSQIELHVSDSVTRPKGEAMWASKRPRCEILNLLSEACLVVRDVQRSDDKFEDRVEDLSQRIRTIPTLDAVGALKPFEVGAIEVYKLATTIYLVRASQRPTGSTPWLDSLIELAFQTHMKACTCPHFFPLLILACEAKNDERRLAVLEMLERVNSDSAIRSIDQLKDVIRALWAQQDLNSDVDLLANYTSLLDTAVSSSSGLPSFA